MVSPVTGWVLLRGLMRDARHWGEFPQQFGRAVGAAWVITPDFPGNGSLYRQASPCSVESMVEFLRAELQRRNLAPPYRVLGLSLGAMVAMAWSAKYPAEVERMVLVNTSLAPHSPFHHRLRPANYPALLATMLAGSLQQRERLILRLTSNLAARSPQGQAIRRQWLEWAAQCPVSRANILRQLCAAMRYRAPQQAPSMPLLLLSSAQDRLVDARCSLALFKSWNCAMRIHPAAGHDLPLDDGAWVARQVAEWLA